MQLSVDRITVDRDHVLVQQNVVRRVAGLRYVIADLKHIRIIPMAEWNESNDFVRQKAFGVAWKWRSLMGMNR